jgi:hypothetical protein
MNSQVIPVSEDLGPHEKSAKYLAGPLDKIEEEDKKAVVGLPKNSVVKKVMTKRDNLCLEAHKIHGLIARLIPIRDFIRSWYRAIIKRKALPGTNHSLVDIAAYKIDKYISSRRGQIATLAICGAILVLILGITLSLASPSIFGEDVWKAWTFMADSGSHTNETKTSLRVLGALMTMIGILYFSVIMGFVVDGIREKMDNLKKGKSRVAEVGHTLMLGWTDKSISLIRQICLANESENGGVIVVLAEMEKEVLELQLASQIKTEELRGTQVVFRTGTPLLSVDLLKVAAHRAKSIIILANPVGDADRSDAAVLRTVLSLKTLPEIDGHVVAELRDIDNEALLRLVGGDQVDILVSHDVIGRLVLMAARSPGLAKVFSALLGYEGNEFYIKEWPELVGEKFGSIAVRFPDAVPLGIKNANGEVIMRPDFDTVIAEGDEIIVLAEDDDTYKVCDTVNIIAGSLPPEGTKTIIREKILMCGWRRDIRDMITLLDSLVLKGTELHMVCEEPVSGRNRLLLDSGLNVNNLKNLTIKHHYGNTAIRRHMETLPLHIFTSMMFLADQSRETDIMHSDSHCLASLLLTRDLQRQMLDENLTDSGKIVPECKCISEILDPRTQKTISRSETILKCSEFIQSNEIISCILAMISESREVRVILEELLGPNGSYFAVESSTRYCNPSEMLSFWQLSKRAMNFGEILSGYQIHGSVEETVLNPPEKNCPRNWADIDLIILRSKSSEQKTIRRNSSVMLGHLSAATTVKKESFQKSQTQQLLQTIVKQQENSEIEKASQAHRDALGKAMQSYLEFSNSTNHVGPKSSKSLVGVTKIFLETLEKLEVNYIDDLKDSDDEGKIFR